jgi:hypothetical protein
MPQSRHQELEKASETDLDQNATQIYGEATFDWEYPTSVLTCGFVASEKKLILIAFFSVVRVFEKILIFSKK